MQTVAAGHLSYYRHVSHYRHVSRCRLRAQPPSQPGHLLGVLSSKAPTQTGLKLKPQNSGLIAATRPTQPSHSTDRAGWLPLRCPGHQGFIYFNFCLAGGPPGRRPCRVPCSWNIRVTDTSGSQPSQPAGSASTSTRPEYTFYTTATTTTTAALLADGNLLLPVVLHNLIILIRYRLVMENPRCLASGEQRPSIRLSEKSLNWLKLNQTLKYCSGIIKSSQSYLMWY